MVFWINNHFNFRSLPIFPSRILECATGFCSSISLFIWRFTFGELFLTKTKIKSGKIYRHKSMHVSRSTKPFTNHSWQVWRSIYNNHIDFKISPTVIWVQRNKQCSKMHKAISTKVQGKTSFGTKTQQSQSNFLIF